MIKIRDLVELLIVLIFIASVACLTVFFKDYGFEESSQSVVWGLSFMVIAFIFYDFLWLTKYRKIHALYLEAKERADFFKYEAEMYKNNFEQLQEDIEQGEFLPPDEFDEFEQEISSVPDGKKSEH